MKCRPQFTLRALLVLMLVVAAFFGGMAVSRQLSLRERDRLWAQIDYLERTFVNRTDP